MFRLVWHLLTKAKTPIDLNAFAKEATLLEGKQVSQSIAQVKETLRVILVLLRREFEENPRGVISLLQGERNDL